MNWLAHLYLSEPAAEFRIGNVIADALLVAEVKALPSAYQRGVERHRTIDAFTDAHPVVRRSIGRLVPPHRRFGGVLIDMFYDHFLATNWSRFSEVTLEEFAKRVYAEFEMHEQQLPSEAMKMLQHIRTKDRLCSYREVAGVRHALEGIGMRLRRPYQLGESIVELERHYEALQEDFMEFFPLLRAQVGMGEADNRMSAFPK
jgi:acyl carrier protein phosphodiesterase